MATVNRHMKINNEIPKQIRVMLRYNAILRIEISDMAARRPIWKWCHWKPVGFYPYTQVLCYWSLDLIFNAKLKLESGNKNNAIWPPGGHLKSDIAENQQASAYGHNQIAHEIWSLNPKANLTYASETTSSTDGRTDKVVE